MLDAIRDKAQGWIAKVILGLLIVPFALWGIDSYFTGGGEEKPAATVNGDNIPQREFLRALRNQKESLGGKVDEKVLRQSVIDQLVNTRLLTAAAIKQGYRVSDAQVQAMLAGVEIFQENGQFSQSRLDTWLASRNLTQRELVEDVRRDQLLQLLQVGLGGGTLAPRPGVAQLAEILGQQREVNEISFDVKRYLAQVSLDDKTVQAEYEANKTRYATPRQLRVQYLVLSQAALEQTIQIADDAARKFYDANASRYQAPEQRRASHILIQVAQDADAKTREAARVKAQQLLADVQKTPARFAELARQHSQDPGSAKKGGELGAFTRDMMVKPFADAAWSMKPGELRGLVESQFGYHIIRLDAVVAGAKPAFETIRADIIGLLRQQEAQRRFAEQAERFSNLVYEQPDSLEHAAKAFGLTLQTSDWIDEKHATPAFLAQAKVLEALFASDSLEKHHNIEAVEVAPNTLVSARVLEYRPAGVRAFADVAAGIRAGLVEVQARKLASDAGKQALANAQAGQALGGWSTPMTLSRMQPLNMPREAVKAIFRADASKLPAFAGVDTPDGYRLYRISRVTPAATAATLAQQMQADVRRMLAQEEVRAYLESLKADATIKIEPATLEAKAD